MIVRSKAPFRLEFAGGGTDVPPFTDDQGGLIFNATIDHYAYCSIKSRSDNEFKVHSLDYNIIARFKDKNDLQFDGNLDLIKAVIKRMSQVNQFKQSGMDITLYSDIPAGSGLGSSSTVCVALVGAIATYYRIPLSRYEIAHLAYEIERLDLGIAGGLQDQYAAAFGGFNLMEFHKKLEVIVNPLRISTDILNELLYHLVVVNTGKSRMSDGILRDQVNLYITEPNRVLPFYIRSKELAIMMKNAVVSGDTHKFGVLLGEAFQNKKKLSTKIATEQMELLYDTAIRNGAIGGRIMGAGGGGHMVFYVEDLVQRQPMISALEVLGAKNLPFSFDQLGLQTWIAKE